MPKSPSKPPPLQQDLPSQAAAMPAAQAPSRQLAYKQRRQGSGFKQSFYLFSPETVGELAQLTEYYQTTEVAVVRMAIRQLLDRCEEEQERRAKRRERLQRVSTHDAD